MRLLGSLYSIESQSCETVGCCGTFGLLMLDGHPVYEGHFPGNPITPGVLTLSMVRECAESFTGSSLKYRTIKNCRFVAMVRPGERLTLNLELSEAENGYQITADLTDRDGNPCLQLEGMVCGQRSEMSAED
jgi:3-hydroxyacyl-[acyl-carrier-protein] dehydratase